MAEKTEAQKKAQKKYMEKFMVAQVRMEREKYSRIQVHAEQQGQSVNAYINAAIDEKMCRDDLEAGTAALTGGVVSVYSGGEKATPVASKSPVEGGTVEEIE